MFVHIYYKYKIMYDLVTSYKFSAYVLTGFVKIKFSVIKGIIL